MVIFGISMIEGRTRALLNTNVHMVYIPTGNTRDQYCASYAIGTFSIRWRQNPTLSSKGIHHEHVTQKKKVNPRMNGLISSRNDHCFATSSSRHPARVVMANAPMLIQ